MMSIYIRGNSVRIIEFLDNKAISFRGDKAKYNSPAQKALAKILNGGELPYVQGTMTGAFIDKEIKGFTKVADVCEPENFDKKGSWKYIKKHLKTKTLDEIFEYVNEHFGKVRR